MNDVLVPVLYTDIDGTIRLGKDELGYFVNTADDVIVFPGVPELLAEYKAHGWRIIGVTNQGGIGLGYMDENTCLLALAETNRQCENVFDKIVFCPHKPDANCPCRKPKIGMILDSRLWLFQQFGEAYPNHLGLFTGDRPEDEECAKNAGLPFIEAKDWREGKHLAALYS